MSQAQEAATGEVNAEGVGSQIVFKDVGCHILLKVVGLKQINFRVRMSTKLGRLKRIYAERLGVSLTSLRFMYHGSHVNNETAGELHMKNNDVIEVSWCCVTGTPCPCVVEFLQMLQQNDMLKT